MRTRSVLDRSHCFFRRAAAATPRISEPAELRPSPSAVVETPNGRAVADEAFAWLNRQLSWQSTLADLERVVARYDVAESGWPSPG